MDKNKNAGRPPFKPTKHMRDLVETSVAAGLTTVEIASVLGGISRTTLNLYFTRELKDARARRLGSHVIGEGSAARLGFGDEIFVRRLFSAGAGSAWQEGITKAAGSGGFG